MHVLRNHLSDALYRVAACQRRLSQMHGWKNGMFWTVLAIACFLIAPRAGSQVASSPVFLGAQSCGSTSCHGGAGNNKDQFTIWTKYDFHHLRPCATLETPRAERIAQALKIGAPAQSAACTVCHAPLQTLAAGQLAAGVPITEGVTCESCHGAARSWLRGHTRHDWANADRVQAGMRGLRNLYVRAGVCIACHQNLAADVRAAGHPELIFELDGQAVSQPKHWVKSQDQPGPQIWLVGQAVALREMSWQLAQEKEKDSTLAPRWAGLVWLLQRASHAVTNAQALEVQDMNPDPDRIEEVQRWSDQFAKLAADSSWSVALTRQCLVRLIETADSFKAESIPVSIRARRAERLVLALDRLVMGLADTTSIAGLNPNLSNLFNDVQSLPDFDPQRFARDLEQLNAGARQMLDAK
jgi:hypothetical protein